MEIESSFKNAKFKQDNMYMIQPYVQKAVHPSILAAFKNVALQRHFDILQRHIVILQRHIDIWQRHMTSGSVI